MNTRVATSLWHAASKEVRQVGEPAVWLTAMGLSLCLTMVLGLLLLIFSQGLAVFWPKHVVQYEVEQNGKHRVVGGIVVKEQNKYTSDGKLCPQIQIYTGNREVYGLAFTYLDDNDIKQRSLPADAMMIERIENGNLIGVPVALEIKGEGRIEATDPGFASKLETLLEEVTDRRDEIRKIEKHAIGDNSAEIAELQRDKAGDQADATRLSELQADYDKLAEKAKALRARQSDHSLKMRLLSGEERSLTLGTVIDYSYPNRLSFFAKVGRFCRGLWKFVSDNPRESNTEGGIFPAIFGTFAMTILMSVLVVPFGVLAAIYLREYAKQGTFVRMVRIAVNNLAGVPSIVFGVFGLGFFVYLVGGHIDQWFFSKQLPTPTFGTGGILWASLTLALMTVPVVIVATEESIAAVPRGAREGSLACGASKWQTIQRVVLPASVPGILTGMILAMARGAGEVAPLMLVGVVKLAPSLPIDGVFPYLHFDQKFMHLGFYIYDLGFQSPDSEAARPMVFATTMFLILLVLVLNLGAIMVRERLRRKLQSSVF